MMSAALLDAVAVQSARIGYRQDAIRRDYAYSDVWISSGGTRSVPLVAFTQTPPSYRSAAFAVVEADANAAQALVEGHRALGAPLFFVIEGDQVSSWQVYARNVPRLLSRFPVNRLEQEFLEHRHEWAPDVIHRAKSIGRIDASYQLDFVDIGLIPAIEGEIHTKLDRLIREAVADVGNISSNDAMRLLFRGIFRLLAAKILTDRQHVRALSWNADKVADVLSAMGDYYALSNDRQVWPARTLAQLERVWNTFRQGFNVANISADDLAYVYESTLVTPQARAQFGTHSTPRYVADYILDRFRLWEFGATPLTVYEPFAGAGVFLGSALRQMRDGLPLNWTDKQRHDLLVKHIGGAEIDPFACEVAKLSLILADYPNANGWLVEEADLFQKDALAARLESKDVILCNPPFEAFTSDERQKYPSAWAVDGSKAVFALETALNARPRMLGFVVPNTLLVDRRYREQRRVVEQHYREIELVSLPDGVFNVSQLDTALLIARDRREPDMPQLIRSSSVYDGDKRRFSADRVASHTITEERGPGLSEGKLWSPPLQHIWTALSSLPRLGDIVHGHWGMRWKGGQKEASRVFDNPGRGRAPGYMNSGSLDQFVLRNDQYLDIRPEEIYGGDKYDWDAPKVLANAGRLSRGYWRLAAAVDRQGKRASQQFIALWQKDPTQSIDLDAIAALLNGPVINAFLSEHSFDKRFRIRTLESAPVPAKIPSELGDLAREYARTVSNEDGDPQRLAKLLQAMDALILEAYGLDDGQKDHLISAFGVSERPVRGASARRLLKKNKPHKGTLPLFEPPHLEEDEGEKLGAELSPIQTAARLAAISKDVPLDQWAGRTLEAADLCRVTAIDLRDLAAWRDMGLLFVFPDRAGKERYPVDQFMSGVPVAGMDEVVSAIGDKRVAWLWLRTRHVALDGRSPIDVLKKEGIQKLRPLVVRDFSEWL